MSTPAPRHRFRHVGIVVTDLEAARAHLGELFGIEWGPVLEAGIQARDAQGNEVISRTRACWSVQEPGFELIEEKLGTPWVTNGSSNLHHLSFSSEEVPTDSERLITLDCPLELSGHAPKVRSRAFAFHLDPIGVRIELSGPERVPQDAGEEQ